MPNLNQVFLMGHLTRDVDVRYTPSGMAIADFSIAINTHRKDKQDEVYFANITAFGKQAEVLEQYAGKGTALFVAGRLVRDKWEDNDGNTRSKDKVILSNFQFVGGKKKTDKLPDTEEDDENSENMPF